jgi:hypothetical protein
MNDKTLLALYAQVQAARTFASRRGAPIAKQRCCPRCS